SRLDGREEVHRRGTRGDARAREGTEGREDQGRRGTRRAREDRRDAAVGSRAREAVSRDRHGQRARALAAPVVRDACVHPGRQGRLLLPERGEVQDALRDVRLQRLGEPRRRRAVAGRVRREGADREGRGEDRPAREEGRPLTPEPATPSGPARAYVHPADEPRAALVLGHGAGGGVGAKDLLAAMDAALAVGVTVALIEQPYRVAGRRSPAPAPQLDAAWV